MLNKKTFVCLFLTFVLCVSAVFAQGEGAGSDVAQLTEENGKLKSEKASLETRIKELEREIQALDLDRKSLAAMGKLQSQLSSLKDENTRLKEENSDLKKKNTEAENIESTEQNVETEPDFTNQHLLEIKEKGFYAFVILSGLFLAVIVLLVVILLAGKSRNKEILKLLNELNASISELQKNTGDKLDKLAGDLSSAKRDIVSQITENIQSLNSSFKRLESFITAKMKEAERTSFRPTPAVSDPLTAFNNWASNPTSKLPSMFYYLKNDMKIRTSVTLEESPQETNWITNREGEKYLFPNPNSFTPMTDITELYSMDLNRLKDKGQNKIKITKPCELQSNGSVQYRGELQLL